MDSDCESIFNLYLKLMINISIIITLVYWDAEKNSLILINQTTNNTTTRVKSLGLTFRHLGRHKEVLV